MVEGMESKDKKYNVLSESVGNYKVSSRVLLILNQ